MQVRPLGANIGAKPLLSLERAAMIYLGVPAYAAHINGYVRDAASPDDPRPAAVWLARRAVKVAANGHHGLLRLHGRSHREAVAVEARPARLADRSSLRLPLQARRASSKPTYPGLLDQMVAGGQPSYMGFEENVRKECEEEASLPPEVIAKIKPTGAVSYRYATPKGLSCKTLTTYDIEMPADLTPLCADGEVEEFRLMPVPEVLRSLREDLPLWKPNSALVAIDFCVRHGFVDPTEEGYVELTALLRN